MRARNRRTPSGSAARPRARRDGRDVFVFFDNTDVKLRAPVDARRMAETLGIGPGGTPRSVMVDLGVTPGRTKKAKAAGPAPTKRRAGKR